MQAHCDLVYLVDIDPGKWLVAWRHKAITWTELSMMFSDIMLIVISQETLNISIIDMSLKINSLILQPHATRANKWIGQM